jgi:hypothetical protein
MRILTEDEMLQVFGGVDNTRINTLPNVTVTPPRFRGGTFWVGYSDFTTWAEFGSHTGSWYTTGYPAWGQVLPTDEKILCEANASVVPGHGKQPGYEVHKVNEWGYQAADGTLFTKQQKLTTLPTGTYFIRGSNVADAGSYQTNGTWTTGTTVLYAGAFEPLTNATSQPYYNDQGQLVAGKYLGNMTREEQYVYTAAHEFQHQYQLVTPGYLSSKPPGFNTEADATAFANKALANYRAGAADSCP